MMWQGAGNPGGAYGLQQAMAAQAAAQQQQQQQQAPGMQVCSKPYLCKVCGPSL